MDDGRRFYTDVRAFTERFPNHPAISAVRALLSTPKIMDRVISLSVNPNVVNQPTLEQLKDLTEKVMDTASKELDEFDPNPGIICNRCSEFLAKIDEALQKE